MAEEYIKREDAINVVKAACEACTWNLSGHRIDSFPVCRRCYAPITETNIKEIPTEDVAPVRHGKWIKPTRVPDSMLSECSICGFDTGAFTFKFCPMCGERMDGE